MAEISKRIIVAKRIFKLKLFSTCLIIFSAQGKEAPLSVGIKGGLSIYQTTSTFTSTIYSDKSYFDYRIGPSLTVFGEMAQTRFFFHNFQLSYYQAGGREQSDMSNELGAFIGKGWYDLAVNYVGIGYNAKVKAPVSKVVPYAAAGLSFDYLVNINERLISNDNSNEVSSFNENELARINIRPLITAGFECKVSSKVALLCEYVFSYNLLPFYEKVKTGINPGIKYTTKGHILNMGCKIKI